MVPKWLWFVVFGGIGIGLFVAGGWEEVTKAPKAVLAVEQNGYEKRSSSAIGITAVGNWLAAVNPDSNSLSLINLADDTLPVIEIAVGQDPRTVALTAERAYVANRGSVEDIWGNEYVGGGTYDVWVARPLDLSFGVLPGTPLAVGNRFNPTLSVQPNVPAAVEMRIEHYPYSDPEQVVVYEVMGTANPFGYFDGANPTRFLQLRVSIGWR